MGTKRRRPNGRIGAVVLADRSAAPQVVTTVQPLPRLFWRMIAVLLTVFAFLALYAGVLNGRALWCDEMLRVSAQKMPLADLLRGLNSQMFDTQSNIAYLLQRPFSLLFGYELGAMLTSVTFGLLCLVSLVFAARVILGVRAVWVVLALGLTNPLLFYFSSELGFYVWLCGSTSALLLFLICWLRDPHGTLRGWGYAWLFAATLGTVGSHFSGAFVWLGCVVAAGVIQLRQLPSTRWRAAWVPLVCCSLPAALLCLPVYLQAQRVTGHVGTRNMDLSHFVPAVQTVANHFVHHAPALTGGGVTYLGVMAFALGVVALWRQRNCRSFLLLSLSAMLTPLIFLLYTELRGYLYPVTRYYVCGLFPVILIMGLGLAYFTEGARTRWVRMAGWVTLAGLLAINVLTVSALVGMRGRSDPIKDMMAFIASRPAGRVVVNPNHYVSRFFGGYYPVPNGGSIASPCYYEEGVAARSEGMRRIWRLVPDAILVVPGDTNMMQEVAAAGVYVGHRVEFPFSPLLRWSWDWQTYPERGYYPTGPEPALCYASDEEIATDCRKRTAGLSLPGSGWGLFRYRSLRDSKASFGLYAGGAGTLRVFMPVEGKATLQLTFCPYGSGRLVVSRAGQEVGAVDLKPVMLTGVVIQNRQRFTGYIEPKVLVQADLAIALDIPTATASIDLGVLPAGWHILNLQTNPSATLLLLEHEIH